MVTHSSLVLGWSNVAASTTSSISLSEELSNFLSLEFHAYWSDFSAAFASEAVDVATPKDSAAPTSHQWYQTKVSVTEHSTVSVVDETQTIQATFVCAVCDNITNPCFFDSICNDNGVCECTTGASGTLCQIAPVSNAW